MRKNINKVEIKDPPIRELRKNRSCFTRTCLSGCGCVIIFVIAFLLLLKFAVNPRIKELKKLPDHISKSVPIYDEENISVINFTSGKDSGKVVEIAAIVPKAILAPIIVELNKIKENKNKISSSTREEYFDWEEVKRIIKEPITDQRDSYNIEWTDLSAKPSFIYNYYQTELDKQNFYINISSKGQGVRQFTFNKGEISGAIYIKDDIIKKGTDYVLLKINAPAK